MARPHGFDHFCDHLKGLEEHYVLIGGGAASLLMDDDGIDFRSTKDVDLVVLIRSKDLNDRLIDYIKKGGYQTKEATEKLPRYYRFRGPTAPECPAMIEIFARNELALDLGEDQHIIPINNDVVDKLSAILLDDEYFELIRVHRTKSASGIPLIMAVTNICLKARAHREISDRIAAGDDTAEEKAAQKHLKDIWRLAQLLTGDEKIELAGAPAKDFATAFAKLEKFEPKTFKQVVNASQGATLEATMDVLKKVFLKA